jgi:hypothetical protein
MAAKLRMLKLLQEIRGFAAIANRQPPPRSPALLLAQMRPHVIQPALPRRRLSVAMGEQDRLAIPHPVRINHVKLGPGVASTLPVS